MAKVISDMNHPTETEPMLISFLLIAYKQEEYIESAVNSILNQTYSHLEIVLSDDCSPDATYTRMKALADNYKGPHKIILNRNPTNLGIGEHINKAVALSSGTWICLGAGDDLARPNRVQLTAETVLAAGPGVYSVAGHIENFDSTGRRWVERSYVDPKNVDITYCFKNFAFGLAGASHAFHRRLYDEFGPLNPDVVAEDRALMFRAWLLGSAAVVDDILVDRRIMEGNISVADNSVAGRADILRRFARIRDATYRQYFRDLFHPASIGRLGREQVEDVYTSALKILAEWSSERELRLGTRAASTRALARLILGSENRRTMLEKYLFIQWPRAASLVRRIKRTTT